MIELDDCGSTIRTKVDGGYLSNIDVEAKIQMVIKAPRGTMVIFEPKALKWDYPILGWTKQCGAIKAFMEEHEDD